MFYLGINGGWVSWHDPAAALVEDGKIIAAVEEERFGTVKHAPTLFPVNAIKFCLDQAGIKITDVDKICYFLKPDLMNCLRRGGITRPRMNLGGLFFYRNIKNQVKVHLHHFFRINPKIDFVEHHMAHAASAFFLSGSKKANILTIDGAGERTCTMLAHGKGS